MNVSGPNTILVVDDDNQVRNLMHVFLFQAGFAVRMASDGPQALDCYEQHKDEIVLLLTDIDMPPMNGLELAQRIRAASPQLPVVLVSGNFTVFGGSPPRDYFLIEKPFSLHALVDVVQTALGSRVAPHRSAAGVCHGKRHG